jgi:hypothetical protein
VLGADVNFIQKHFSEESMVARVWRKKGIELEVLTKLFRKDDAELCLTMTQKLETAEQIAKRDWYQSRKKSI